MQKDSIIQLPQHMRPTVLMPVRNGKVFRQIFLWARILSRECRSSEKRHKCKYFGLYQNRTWSFKHNRLVRYLPCHTHVKSNIYKHDTYISIF